MAEVPPRDALDAIVLPPEDPPLEEGEKAELDEARDLDRERQKLSLDSLRQDVGLRGKYANQLFCLTVGWLIAVLVVLVLQGLLSPRGLFNLPENVLLALIGGTTTSVIAIFLIVVNYLFPKTTL